MAVLMLMALLLDSGKTTTANHQTAKPAVAKAVPAKVEANIINRDNLKAAAKIDRDVLKQILAKNTEDLAEQFVGIWDNDNQSFFEPELNIPKELRHPRLFVKVTELKSPLFYGGDKSIKTLLVDYREGGESGKSLKTRIFKLVPDISANSVRRDVYDAKPNLTISNIDRLLPSDFIQINGCSVYFHRRVSGFYGDTIPGSCLLKSLDGKIIKAAEHHDIDDKFWEVTDLGIKEDGKIAYGTIDNSPIRLRKANQYQCWVSYSGSGKIQTVSNLKIYDAGGEVKADFGKDSVRLRLRNVEWPSGNSRPSLTLYLLQNNMDYSNIYSWSDEGANRIALSYNYYQASCTKL